MIDLTRLTTDIDALGQIGATERGGVNRTSYSAVDLEARAWLAERALEAGLGFRVDAIGNCYVSLVPSELEGRDRAAVWTGSHIDTVPDGGRLDGAYGVLAGLECLRVLAADVEAGALELVRPVEVVAFVDEEGAYASFVGSRGLVDGWTVEALSGLVGRDGEPISDGLARIGSSVEAAAAQPTIGPDEVAAYVELHIEQGPVLENDGVEVGVVTDIVEVGHGHLVFRGRADHAGTTPMGLRLDASLGAGAFLVGLPSVVAEHGSPAAVGTCGMISSLPGAANIVAEEVKLSLDVRDRAGELEAVVDGVAALAEQCGSSFGLEVDLEWSSVTPGVVLDAGLQGLVAEAAEAVGVSHQAMVSGAGHDAQVMARAVPAGMIFVPSEQGRSHSPVESTNPRHLEVGANVLLGVLRSLSQR